MWSNKRHTKKDSPLKDAAAKMIAAGMVNIQMKLVCRLQRLEQALSLRQKKTLFLLLLLLGCAYCSYLLAAALFEKHQDSVLPAVTKESSIPPMLPPPPYLPGDSLSGSKQTKP